MKTILGKVIERMDAAVDAFAAAKIKIVAGTSEKIGAALAALTIQEIDDDLVYLSTTTDLQPGYGITRYVGDGAGFLIENHDQLQRFITYLEALKEYQLAARRLAVHKAIDAAVHAREVH
jgi:hypothetical protein